MHIAQPQLSTKFFGTLFHAANPNSNTIRLKLHNSPPDSLAIVSNGHYDHSFPLSQGNPHLARFGVPENIGQSFLNDSKDSRLYLSRQPRKIGRQYVERRFDSATLGESLNVPGKRRQQPDFIKKRRMQ